MKTLIGVICYWVGLMLLATVDLRISLGVALIMVMIGFYFQDYQDDINALKQTDDRP